MKQQTTAVKYSESRALFDIRCDYTWHRKFTTADQVKWLRHYDAALVTYITPQISPFESKVSSQTVIKMRLEPTNDYAGDVAELFNVLHSFQPDGYKILTDDDTYPDAEVVVALWWHTRRISSHRASVSPDVNQTECVKIELGQSHVMRTLTTQFEGRAIFVHGSGPWLVTDQPLSEEHVKILMEMIQ